MADVEEITIEDSRRWRYRGSDGPSLVEVEYGRMYWLSHTTDDLDFAIAQAKAILEAVEYLGGPAYRVVTKDEYERVVEGTL